MRNATFGHACHRGNFALTDVPDSCYRRCGFSVYDSEESVYGDQGQKVAWEVREERFAKREQEGNKENKVARQVRSRGQRFIGAFVDIGQARPLHDDIQTEREHEHVVGS